METLFDVLESVLRDRSKSAPAAYSPEIEKLLARLREAFDERAGLDPRAILAEAIREAVERQVRGNLVEIEYVRREGYEAGLLAGRAETITTAGKDPFGLGAEGHGRGDDRWLKGAGYSSSGSWTTSGMYGVPSGSRVYKPGELEAELAASAKYDAKMAAEKALIDKAMAREKAAFFESTAKGFDEGAWRRRTGKWAKKVGGAE